MRGRNRQINVKFNAGPYMQPLYLISQIHRCRFGLFLFTQLHNVCVQSGRGQIDILIPNFHPAAVQVGDVSREAIRVRQIKFITTFSIT